MPTDDEMQEQADIAFCILADLFSDTEQQSDQLKEQYFAEVSQLTN